MLALLAAAAVLSSSAPAAPSGAPGPGAGTLDTYVANEMAWVKANLDTEGWNLVTVGADVLIFLRTAPAAADGDPTVSVRGEHYPFARANPIGAGESFLSKDEVDCARKLERTVSSTVYRDGGLHGDIASASDEPGTWMPIKDGTFMAAAVKVVCPLAAGPR